jgi:hypothetical protein
MTTKYVVCNGNHQRVSPDFDTRPEAESAMLLLLFGPPDDGFLHVVEKQTREVRQ